MKKIALFGATGGTGSAFLTQALHAGYEVKCLVRSPEKLNGQAKSAEVIRGDVLALSDVRDTVAGTDVVVSLFGHVKDSPDWLQTDGTENIVTAMKACGVRKVISLSGGGLPYPEKDKPKFPDKMIKLIMKVAVPRVLRDAEAHADVLRNSGLDWTIVRGPRLTHEPKKGQYRVGWVGVNASTKVGREDLADFLLKQVESDEYVRQMPFVSY